MKTSCFPQRYLLLTLLLCFCVKNTKAQLIEPCTMPAEEISNVDTVFAFFLRQEISQTAHVNSNGAFANTAGLSLTDDNLDLSYNFTFKRSALELSIAGRAKDGLLEVSRDSKLNNKFTLGANYKIVLSSKMVLDITKINKVMIEDCNTIGQAFEAKAKMRSVLEERIADTLVKWKLLEEANAALKNLQWIKELQSYQPGAVLALDTLKATRLELEMAYLSSMKYLLEIKYDKLRASQANDLQRLKGEFNQITEKTREDSAAYLFQKNQILREPQLILDSLLDLKNQLNALEAEVKRNTFDEGALKRASEKVVGAELALDAARFRVISDRYGANYIYHQDEILRERERKTDQFFSEMEPNSIRMHWLNFGVGWSRDEFSRYIDTLPHLDRIQNTVDLIPTFSGSYTYYCNGAYTKKATKGFSDIRFFNLNLDLSLGNNTDDLKQISLETRDSLSPNQFKITTQNVYEGDYLSEILRARLKSDWYHYLGKLDFAGYHVGLSVDMGPSAPVTSLRLGALLSVLDKSKSESLVNFEVFYSFNDLFKNRGQQTLLSRNVLGIQASLPFSIKYKNHLKK